MNSQGFYFQLQDIQKRAKSVGESQLYQELQCFVELHPWRSPLIYAGLYIRQMDYPDVSAFFARKTLEAMEEVCGRGIEADRETLLRRAAKYIYRLVEKPGVEPILAAIRRFFQPKTTARTTKSGYVAVSPKNLHASQAAKESEELQLTKKRLDQLLVATAFLVFAFDNTALRAGIGVAERGIAGKIRRIRERFVDRVPLNDYVAVLEPQFREGNEEAIQPLVTFFDELVRSAGLEKLPSCEQRAVELKECVELLIEEAGRRIEKPDRVFSYADSLGSISQYAEWLFDLGEARFFDKYKWAYPRGQSFDDLNAFWVACMIGLFAFDQAVDRSLALAQATKQAEVEATAAIEAEGEEGPVVKAEQASQEEETQQKERYPQRHRSLSHAEACSLRVKVADCCAASKTTL
jgi:hypothetical protein